MKIAAGLLFASIAIANTFADSNEKVNFYPAADKPLPASALTGLGPAVPADPKEKVNFYPAADKPLPASALTGLGPAVPGGNNPKLKKGLEELGATPINSTDNTRITFDPRSQPKVDPKNVGGLGPQTNSGVNPNFKLTQQVPSPSSNPSSNYLTVDPRTLHEVNPKELPGLGPQRSSNDPNLRKRVEQVANTPSSQNGKKEPENSPAVTGLGPVVAPSKPGYRDQNDKIWEGLHPNQGASKCADVCPSVYMPVCGSDGVKYSNACLLGIASCKNPEKNITKASDEACSYQASLKSYN